MLMAGSPTTACGPPLAQSNQHGGHRPLLYCCQCSSQVISKWKHLISSSQFTLIYRFVNNYCIWRPFKGPESNFHPVHIALHLKQFSLMVLELILWSSGKGQARIGKGWQSRRKASKPKPLPRAYTKVGCHLPTTHPPTTHPKVSLQLTTGQVVVRWGRWR